MKSRMKTMKDLGWIPEIDEATRWRKAIIATCAKAGVTPGKPRDTTMKLEAMCMPGGSYLVVERDVQRHANARTMLARLLEAAPDLLAIVEAFLDEPAGAVPAQELIERAIAVRAKIAGKS